MQLGIIFTEYIIFIVSSWAFQIGFVSLVNILMFFSGRRPDTTKQTSKFIFARRVFNLLRIVSVHCMMKEWSDTYPLYQEPSKRSDKM